MAGDIFAKERAIITLTSTGASIAQNTAAVANATADLDCRSAGNAAEDLEAIFSLQCQWATVTNIVGNTPIADLHLIPALDGTNFPDVDTTASASNLGITTRVGSFICAKAPTANTNMLFVTAQVILLPILYRPYIINVSGQTISANWTLKVVTSRMQYT